MLCSEAAAALARESLPSGLSLCDLGAYQLKDLDRSERVFQLEGEGLWREFPPLRSTTGPSADGGTARDAVSSATRGLRVVVAEDNALLREGLRRLLADAGFEVVGLVADAASLLEVVEHERPQVVVTDIRMPPSNTTEGIDAARAIRRLLPGTAVLLMSHHVETEQVLELLEDDPRGLGYVLKDRVAEVAAFVDVVRRLARGESAIDPEVVSRLVRRSRDRSPIDELSQREHEVLALMAEGRSNQAIATTLHMSAKTVETHVGSIFTKLGLPPAEQDHRRVLAVLAYLRR
ncbi:MAG TPA: response regulator transcription factor [Acidimicrobiales bacterium]|nr:response regulator transcription factor [Acidimicrobiales bacterium]